MLQIAVQHVYCAQHLLENNAELGHDHNGSIDTLLPVSSLIFTAFELTFKALLLHDPRPVKQYKNLQELIELNGDLGFSSLERQQLKTLSRQQAYRKGIDYNLWENRQELHVFCADMITLYERMQDMLPLELHPDYQT